MYAPLLVRKRFIQILPLKNIIQPYYAEYCNQNNGAKLEFYICPLIR